MALFSDPEIHELIACEKTISDPPARALKLVGADWRNNAKLNSAAYPHGVFFMFMRRNEDFPENFSVGLQYQPNDGRTEITLLRCNGKHGIFTGLGDAQHPHWDFHIHTASESAQDAGFAPEKYAAQSTAFASYEQAVQHFVRMVNIVSIDAHKHFPDRSQGTLFVN